VGKVSPRSVKSTATSVVSLVLGLIKRPTSKTGRYIRWIPVGWTPIPCRGETPQPDQRRFRLKLRVIHQSDAEVDAWAETGESLSERAVFLPHMEVKMNILLDPDRLPRDYHEIAAVLHQTVRHELEHLLDEGYLALPGPKCRPQRGTTVQERWQKSVRLTHWYRIRLRLFARGEMTRHRWKLLETRVNESASSIRGKVIDYIVSARELNAFTRGFQAEAKYRRVTWDVPMHEYIDSMVDGEKMTHEEGDAAKTMLVKWAMHCIPHAPISEATIARYL